MRKMSPQSMVESSDENDAIWSSVHITDRVTCDICGYSQGGFVKLLPTLAQRHVDVHRRTVSGGNQSRTNETVDPEPG